MMVRLGDVGQVITGTTPKTSETENYDKNDICFIKPSDIYDDKISYLDSSEYYISEKARSKARILPKESVLVTCIGIIGKVAVNKVECAFNQQINAIIPSAEKCNASYLAYSIQYNKPKLQDIANAPVVPILNKTQFSNVRIRLCSLSEQEKITQILDKVTDLIFLRKQQIAKLDDLVKSQFFEMFGDPMTNPMGWAINDFEDICSLITDGEHATPRRTNKGIYLLSARNILNHSLQLDDVDYIDEEEYARIAKRVIPRENDILISCSGSIGRCCCVPPDIKFQMVRSAALLRFQNFVNPVFAEYLITSEDMQSQIQRSVTQSSQANLFQGKIKKLHGYIPPLELQDRFAAFVAQVDKSKLTVNQSLEKLEALRKSLMQKYFG